MKQSPNQLTLSLTFTDPTPAVTRAISTLLEIADESDAPSSVGYPDGQKSDTCNPSAAISQSPMRKKLRQLAGCTVLAHHKSWHTVWVEAYHEFFNRTGVHPVSASGEMGLKAHLDVIFTKPGWPVILQEILEGMLKGEVCA